MLEHVSVLCIGSHTLEAIDGEFTQRPDIGVKVRVL